MLSGRLSEAFVFCLSADMDQPEAAKFLQNRPFDSGKREAPLYFFWPIISKADKICADPASVVLNVPLTGSDTLS